VLRPCQQEKLARGTKDEERTMSSKDKSAVAVIGIDIGKNSFHFIGSRRDVSEVPSADIPSTQSGQAVDSRASCLC